MAEINVVTVRRDGKVYYPDTIVGSELYYGIRLDDWLSNEALELGLGDWTLDSAVWTLDTGLSKTNEVVLSGNKTRAKIDALEKGNFLCRCHMSCSTAGGDTQTPTAEIYLIVR